MCKETLQYMICGDLGHMHSIRTLPGLQHVCGNIILLTGAAQYKCGCMTVYVNALTLELQENCSDVVTCWFH